MKRSPCFPCCRGGLGSPCFSCSSCRAGGHAAEGPCHRHRRGATVTSKDSEFKSQCCRGDAGRRPGRCQAALDYIREVAAVARPAGASPERRSAGPWRESVPVAPSVTRDPACQPWPPGPGPGRPRRVTVTASAAAALSSPAAEAAAAACIAAIAALPVTESVLRVALAGRAAARHSGRHSVAVTVTVTVARARRRRAGPGWRRHYHHRVTES